MSILFCGVLPSCVCSKFIMLRASPHGWQRGNPLRGGSSAHQLLLMGKIPSDTTSMFPVHTDTLSHPCMVSSAGANLMCDRILIYDTAFKLTAKMYINKISPCLQYQCALALMLTLSNYVYCYTITLHKYNTSFKKNPWNSL